MVEIYIRIIDHQIKSDMLQKLYCTYIEKNEKYQITVFMLSA